MDKKSALPDEAIIPKCLFWDYSSAVPADFLQAIHSLNVHYSHHFLHQYIPQSPHKDYLVIQNRPIPLH